MKTFLLFTLCIIPYVVVCAVPSQEALRLSIAIPNHASTYSSECGGKREVGYPVRDGHFHVILTNVSQETQRVWTEGCSLGWELLSFELTDDQGQTWTARKKPAAWARNFPQRWQLKPHESVVLNVEFANPKRWDGFPKAKNSYGFSTKVINMRAVFEISKSEAAKHHSIWTGRIVSTREQYSFPYE